MIEGTSFNSKTSEQIKTFLNVVESVNAIPNVEINLSSQTDQQRDSLAFAVNEIYRQFQDNGSELVLARFDEQIKKTSLEKDPKAATSNILNLVAHLFESRVIYLMNSGILSLQQKERLELIHQLYKITIKSSMDKTPKGKPVSLAGIPKEFLPQWYKDRAYLQKTP